MDAPRLPALWRASTFSPQDAGILPSHIPDPRSLLLHAAREGATAWTCRHSELFFSLPEPPTLKRPPPRLSHSSTHARTEAALAERSRELGTGMQLSGWGWGWGGPSLPPHSRSPYPSPCLQPHSPGAAAAPPSSLHLAFYLHLLVLSATSPTHPVPSPTLSPVPIKRCSPPPQGQDPPALPSLAPGPLPPASVMG